MTYKEAYRMVKVANGRTMPKPVAPKTWQLKPQTQKTTTQAQQTTTQPQPSGQQQQVKPAPKPREYPSESPESVIRGTTTGRAPVKFTQGYSTPTPLPGQRHDVEIIDQDPSKPPVRASTANYQGMKKRPAPFIDAGLGTVEDNVNGARHTYFGQLHRSVAGVDPKEVLKQTAQQINPGEENISQQVLDKTRTELARKGANKVTAPGSSPNKQMQLALEAVGRWKQAQYARTGTLGHLDEATFLKLMTPAQRKIYEHMNYRDKNMLFLHARQAQASNMQQPSPFAQTGQENVYA